MREVAPFALTGSMEKEGDLPVGDGFITLVGKTEYVIPGRGLRLLWYRELSNTYLKRACPVTAAVIVMHNMYIQSGIPLPRKDEEEAKQVEDDNNPQFPAEVRDDLNGRLVRSRIINYFFPKLTFTY
ncbi:UNVERIFIED_CONTAM: hypothetical protein FKN15_051005 [Acipenser sinensis]